MSISEDNSHSSEINKTLAVNNAPTATITGMNAVCQGESATFTAVGGTSYLWSNGATTADISVNTAGTYSVTVTDVANCEAKGERILTINANPTADHKEYLPPTQSQIGKTRSPLTPNSTARSGLLETAAK